MDWSYNLPVPASAPNAGIKASESARKALENQRNNQAGPAVSEHQVKTTGVGNLRPADMIMFAVTFVQEPHFGYGSALTKHPDPARWFDPSATGLVRSWVQDHQGMYVGARISLRIVIDADTAAEGTDFPRVEMLHFLTFSGIAFKPLTDIQPELGDMTPRQVSF